MSYYFEWNLIKSNVNKRKHGVSFDEGSTVFADPLAMNMADPDHSIEEDRFILLGMSFSMRLLVVAYAERGVRTRIISVRRATQKERRQYEEGKD